MKARQKIEDEKATSNLKDLEIAAKRKQLMQLE